MVKTAIQLYTLRKFDVKESTKVRIASETDVDGVEMEYYGPPSDATLAALDETGLEVAGLSAGLDDFQHSLDELVTTCKAFDCETIILGYLDEKHFRSVQATHRTANLLNSLADTVNEQGLRFLYHTNRHEFTSSDGRTHFDILADETDDGVEFELDLGWIGVTGTNPHSVLEDFGHRTASVHLKDMRFEEEKFVNLGDGDLNVRETAQAAIDVGVEWLVYEHEDPVDPVESVVAGASKLSLFKKNGLTADSFSS
ncbi:MULTISPECIES: sugar phosphate isomerase/epimerase [unclassified Haladaptatus]|uniref:sugar phosphate isomerase/epimerase family protein n=1 Tax=unclassified Haladaptatus TaxID=2622732 RepID=UPI00209C6793|nr:MULTISPECIES: sugar phosphate isomerase/epimerase [unclassified Haladaptatus]MCO8245268.1 sugar phosphate isomerase/epimerase [Haladaptatus sp. AB643]MCO8256598.1 sugar phosphate isomerase/epimerase [Haladaptatus sp. AB618]